MDTITSLISLLPQIDLTPLNIGVTLVVILVAVVFLSCGLAGLFHRSDTPKIRKWG